MSTTASRTPRKGAVVALVTAGVLALSGCAAELRTGFLPTDSEGATNHTDSVISLWNNAWIAALAIGVLVWGLLIWCLIVYRKRKGDNQLPVQLRYHVPLELMYTFVPIVMIGVFFAFTSKTMGEIVDTSAEPDVTIEVVGKRWSWDFNYIDSDVHFAGVQAQLTGEPGVAETLPTLYLPQGENVELVLRTRDVNHALWVPAFLMKMDMIAGRTNSFQIVPQKLGTYEAKCAELCGQYHASMLFNVEVVTPEEYEAQMQALAEAGNTGILGPEYDTQPHSTLQESDEH